MSGRQKTALVSQRERSHATLAPDDQPKQSPYTVIPWQYYALLNNEELSDEDMTLASRVYKGLHGVDYVSQTGATFKVKEEPVTCGSPHDPVVNEKRVIKKVVASNNTDSPLYGIAKIAVRQLNDTEKGVILNILCRELGYELE